MIKTVKSHFPAVNYFKDFFSLQKIVKTSTLFLKNYYFGNGTSCFPINFDLVITSRCNLKCSFCNYKPCLNKINHELTTKEWIKFIDSVAYNKPSFFLTGGEPFVRPDIMKILEHMYKKDLSFGIVTNGTLLNEETNKLLIKYKTENLFFSLHGTKKTHDELVCQKNAFEKITTNIKYFTSKKKRPKIVINFVVDEKNINEIPEVLKICDELKIDYFRFQHKAFLLPREVKEHQELFNKKFPNINYKIINNFVSKAPKLSEPLMNINETNSFPKYFQPYLSKKETKSWYSNNHNLKRVCPIVWLTSTIQSNGEVIPCSYYDLSFGNIKNQKFENIWNSQRYKQFRIELKKGLFPGCKRCTRL
ncbi:radical SAM protein [archaeon]|mgnify:CR=1 FL=1|jgi:AdoMet-dependent heme synthase|nr:radical SAM protein [archaeon]MBT3721611.1 radical SAM protein [archaeon]MBT4272220.1 radical SAM protein [archaeon]MBT4460627.1 radical SAM protein [archaeon]MBT4857994.1 radical SAM protein [archaeon]